MSRPPKLTAAQYAAVRTPRPAPRAKRARKAPRQSEAALLKQVLAWLTLKGVFHWRQNSGAGLRRGRPVRAAPEGTPDVLCVFPHDVGDGRPQFIGRLVAVELKAKGGRLRPAQRAWMQNAERAGVLCLVVRSLQELIDAFGREGLE